MSLRLEGGTLEEHISSLGDLDAFSAELHVSCLPLDLKPAGLKNGIEILISKCVFL